MNKKKLRIAILKEIESKNYDISEKNFESVNVEDFDEAANFLLREKYIIGVRHGDDRPIFHDLTARLTEKGEDYLEENSTLAKTYRGFKEFRDWFK